MSIISKIQVKGTEYDIKAKTADTATNATNANLATRANLLNLDWKRLKNIRKGCYEYNWEEDLDEDDYPIYRIIDKQSLSYFRYKRYSHHGY